MRLWPRRQMGNLSSTRRSLTMSGPVSRSRRTRPSVRDETNQSPPLNTHCVDAVCCFAASSQACRVGQDSHLQTGIEGQGCLSTSRGKTGVEFGLRSFRRPFRLPAAASPTKSNPLLGSKVTIGMDQTPPGEVVRMSGDA